jgi:hypothetical protein
VTWIRTVPLSQADESLLRAIEGQRELYPIEYATPVHPTPDGPSTIVASHSLIPQALYHAARLLPRRHAGIFSAIFRRGIRCGGPCPPFSARSASSANSAYCLVAFRSKPGVESLRTREFYLSF